MSIRKIFWNYKTAFFGMGFITFIPKTILFYPVCVGVPLYAAIALHSGNKYYDEYDGDVTESPAK